MPRELSTDLAPARRTLLAIAVVGPPVLTVIFRLLFHWVQARGVPTGSLEGIDLTPFALRDQRMMWTFAVVLVVFVIWVALGARSWRARLAVVLAGSAAALVSYAAVFVSLLAGGSCRATAEHRMFFRIRQIRHGGRPGRAIKLL